MIQIVDPASVTDSKYTFRIQNQRSDSELRIHIQDSDQDYSGYNIKI